MQLVGWSAPWAVVSALAAVLLLPPACASEDEEEGAPDGLSLNEGGNTVIVGSDWKSCSLAEECVRVATSCDGCCGAEAVASVLEEEYRDAMQDMCADYEGGVCDCAPLPTMIVCDLGECALVPEPDDD